VRGVAESVPQPRPSIGAQVSGVGVEVARQWRARVEEIPEVISGRQLRPSDPGRPTDTGVLLVKLMLLEPAPFKLGQRIDASIELVAPANPIASVHEEP